MIVLPNSLDMSRVGVTASRRVGSAVERNRAKRLLREAARHLYPHFQSKSLDVMLIARPELASASEEEVEKALGTLLERAEL
jgi:ribonuclease P protein component